jgi:hypothetical protein
VSGLEHFPNGSAIAARRDARGRLKYDVFAPSGGDPVAIRNDRNEAVALALSLPPLPADAPPPWQERQPTLSPRAIARRRELGLDKPEPMPAPPETRADYFETRVEPPRVVEAYARGKAMTRRR